MKRVTVFFDPAQQHFSVLDAETGEHLFDTLAIDLQDAELDDLTGWIRGNTGMTAEKAGTGRFSVTVRQGAIRLHEAIILGWLHVTGVRWVEPHFHTADHYCVSGQCSTEKLPDTGWVVRGDIGWNTLRTADALNAIVDDQGNPRYFARLDQHPHDADYDRPEYRKPFEG